VVRVRSPRWIVVGLAMSEANRQLAIEAADRWCIPPSGFLALIAQESAWNPNAVSPAGAVGLAQLMPGTQRDMGVTDPYDPAQSLNGGARYLDWLRSWVLGQDVELGDDPETLWAATLAAYNWGPGNWRNAYRAHGSGYLGVLPGETSAYVSALLPAFSIGNQSCSDNANGRVSRDLVPPVLLALGLLALA